jgi:hypothetical protein
MTSGLDSLPIKGEKNELAQLFLQIYANPVKVASANYR